MRRRGTLLSDSDLRKNIRDIPVIRGRALPLVLATPRSNFEIRLSLELGAFNRHGDRLDASA